MSADDVRTLRELLELVDELDRRTRRDRRRRKLRRAAWLAATPLLGPYAGDKLAELEEP